jgi:hypothetical protein
MCARLGPREPADLLSLPWCHYLSCDPTYKLTSVTAQPVGPFNDLPERMLRMSSSASDYGGGLGGSAEGLDFMANFGTLRGSLGLDPVHPARKAADQSYRSWGADKFDRQGPVFTPSPPKEYS